MAQRSCRPAGRRRAGPCPRVSSCFLAAPTGRGVARLSTRLTAVQVPLYGGRNDTEARHADLKARVKYLPRDVMGQELRLLGASVAINAIAWQVHLQAHGEKNVIDDNT